MSKVIPARPDGLDWMGRRLAVPVILALTMGLHGTEAIAGSDARSPRPSQVYNHPDVPIEFLGRFGILTLSSDGRVEEAYIGNGRSLSYGDFTLRSAQSATNAYWAAE